MEKATIGKDIKIIYVTAASFPSGIMAAFNTLHSKVPVAASRMNYGISRPENGTIIYRAGVEELMEGEAEKYNCDTLVIKKGSYLSVTVNDFMKNIQAIGDTFKQLIEQPGIDPEGYCVEEYINGGKDVRCMIRLAD